jgi:PH (Pleckstrin Homology) domain-containing protein
MRYKAKVDWFIGVSMLVGIAVPAFIAVTQNLPWMSAASVFAAVLVFGISYPQWYETKPDALIIRSGLTTRVIPYPKITAVRPSKESGSALALSLDRIAIEYGAGNLLIAPQNAQQFMDDIAAHAPQLSKRGLELAL